VSFGIIYSFEFDQYHVLKIKNRAETFGDMILPHAVANEKGTPIQSVKHEELSVA
jgi:hypothetical protein